MATRLWFLCSLVLVVTAVASDAVADCGRCQAAPALCQDIVHCVKTCKLPRSQAAACLTLKLIDAAKYRGATGEAPPAADTVASPATGASGDGNAPPDRSTLQASGRLPPEVIQRVVRQSAGRFRLCYENGRRNNTKLQGRVTVRFVIGSDGKVSNVGNGGSDLPDPGVVSCVVRAFYGLVFPKPAGGIVVVTYPMMFAP